MVNENKGKEYNPIPIYNRKLVRNMLKHKIEKQYRYHNVSEKVNDYFSKYKNVIKDKEN